MHHQVLRFSLRELVKFKLYMLRFLCPCVLLYVKSDLWYVGQSLTFIYIHILSSSLKIETYFIRFYTQSQKIGKPNNIKIVGSNKTKRP